MPLAKLVELKVDGIEGMSRFELRYVAVDITKIMSSFALVMIVVNLIKNFVFTRQAAVYYADKVTKSYEIISAYNIVSILIFIVLCWLVWRKLKRYLAEKLCRINSIKLTHDFFLVNAVTILYVAFFCFYGCFIFIIDYASMPLVFLATIIYAGVITINILSCCYVFIKYFYVFFKAR